jgi:glycosyltransferase involved in cell wall biosynthesis
VHGHGCGRDAFAINAGELILADAGGSPVRPMMAAFSAATMVEMSPMEGEDVDGEQSSRARGKTLRLLVCTPFAPRLDARHGGRATAQLLARVAERHEVAMLCLRSPGERPVDDVFMERCALVEEIPVPGRPSSPRVRWALGALRGLPPWATDCRSPRYAARLRELAAEWEPHVVELHLQAMAQYASALTDCPAHRILVDYDPPSAWAAELVRETTGLRRLARRVELAVWRRYERATRRLFDAIVVFADRDVSSVAATAGTVRVVRIPLAFDVPAEPFDPLGESPPTVLFVGGFRHPPNVDAACWLAESIFPRVREQVPEARLELVGDRPGENVRRLAGGSVAVHGSVPDVGPYLNRAAAVAAPIRLGGSMRGKVLEALGGGKALVATPRAAEGVDAEPGEHFLLAATEEDLVDALVVLLRDPERRRQLAGRARAWALQNLSWQRSLLEFERLYESLSRP